MLFKFAILNCFLIYVLCDDLLKVPDIPRIVIGGKDKKDTAASAKDLKLSDKKHVLSAGGNANVEQKTGNAEKVSNYEKDQGFFYMKAYGWNREKKNDHINAQGKQIKASKAGKIYKTEGEFQKKLHERYGDLDKNFSNDRNYRPINRRNMYGDFAKRTGYSRSPVYNPPNDEFKYSSQPQVEYTEYKEGPPSYEIIEPKTSYLPNKEYTRIHYPKISGSYVPDMTYKKNYETYKNSRRYPTKNALWNQGYHATKYYKSPQTDDNNPDDNLVEYYANEKNNSPHELNDPYSNMNSDDEDEGRHYYSDRKMTNYDIDKLRASYSKYNDDYAGSQLLPQKMHIDTPAPSLEVPVVKKKEYRLWEGSHYY